MEKYGLLYYKDTDNIGDDIQSYAASQYLPQIDYLIDRENIGAFIPKENKKVKTIMNAWYIHDKFNLTFSPYIKPLLISMHFKNFPYEDGITVKSDYITKDTKKFLKENGPVGSRDHNTKELLDNLKIDSYFSGCLTLTIKKFDNIKKEKYICATNISEKELKILKTKTTLPIKVINQDIEKGSLSNLSWEERKEKVIELLKTYQAAEFVVTTKLHCALPCLALETNVLVLYDDKFDDRMKTFKEYFNYVNRKDFKNVDISSIKNSNKYVELRNKLIKKCENFINKKEDLTIDLNINEYKYFYNVLYERQNLLKKYISELGAKYKKECKKSSKFYDKNQELEKIIEKLEQEKTLDYENHKKAIDLLEKEKEKDYNNHKKVINSLEKDKEKLSKELNDIYNSKRWKIVSVLCNIRFRRK